MQSATRFPVMVLAHNEEKEIQSCLDSIFSQNSEVDLDVFVMANGCSDRTEDIVRDYATHRPEVNLVSIALGDKCNAWNVFIHDIAPTRCPDREIYYFVDGDARSGPDAFRKLATALRQDPRALAASAPPGSGRSQRRDRTNLIRERALVANLYALRGTCVRRLHELHVRLPLNLEGDDGLISALIKWDLQPGKGWDDHRIHPCPDACFEFDPMPLTSFAAWRKYWTRLIRYGRRRYEFALLRKRLPQMGLAGLPRDIQELYPEADQLPYEWNGVFTLTHALALCQMRHIGRKRSAQTTNRPKDAPRATTSN